MSGFELNKIVASILLASLITMIVGMVANVLYKPQLNTARGYKIEVVETNEKSSSAQQEEPLNIPELMKLANAEAGKEVAKKCISCHSLDNSKLNKIGPHLWGVFNRDKASVADYKYSSAITSKGGKWDDEALFHFIHKPSQYIKGTKMSFAGISNYKDIANIIAYLKQLIDDK